MLKVSREEAEAWCKVNDIFRYFETSAKNSTHLVETFQGVARGIITLKQTMEDSSMQYRKGIVLNRNAEMTASTDSTSCTRCWWSPATLGVAYIIVRHLHTEKHAEMDLHDTFELFTVKHMYFEVWKFLCKHLIVNFTWHSTLGCFNLVSVHHYQFILFYKNAASVKLQLDRLLNSLTRHLQVRMCTVRNGVCMVILNGVCSLHGYGGWVGGSLNLFQICWRMMSQD